MCAEFKILICGILAEDYDYVLSRITVCLIAIPTDICAKLTNYFVAETLPVLPTNPGRSVDPELQAVPKWQVPECLGCQSYRQNTAHNVLFVQPCIQNLKSKNIFPSKKKTILRSFQIASARVPWVPELQAKHCTALHKTLELLNF